MRMANMHMAWCRRNGLRCEPAAFEPRASDQFARLILDIQGPGAEFFLSCERGIHRQRRQSAAPPLVRVADVAQHSDGHGVDVRGRALVRDLFALIAQLQSSVALPHTGQNATFVAKSRATLAALVGDLQTAWSGLRINSPQITRSYGEPGSLVVDPRSGASASLRAVRHGRLEAFHQAFTRSAKMLKDKS